MPASTAVASTASSRRKPPRSLRSTCGNAVSTTCGIGSPGWGLEDRSGEWTSGWTSPRPLKIRAVPADSGPGSARISDVLDRRLQRRHAAEPDGAAGVLLTGGASRRLGTDKALLDVGGITLAERTARMLDGLRGPALEVGGGYTHLARVVEPTPGSGPLKAVACARQALLALGWPGPALVVATDLPRLHPALLAWLETHPCRRSVVPLDQGRPQPLCARYSGADLDLAVELAASGQHSMRDLLSVADAFLANAEGPDGWLRAAGERDALADVDEPADLRRLLGPGSRPGRAPRAGRANPRRVSG